MDFAAGIRVGARGLAWDLVEVEQLGAQQRLRLRCAAGDLRGFVRDHRRRGLELPDQRLDAREEPLAGLGQDQLARAALEQPDF